MWLLFSYMKLGVNVRKEVSYYSPLAWTKHFDEELKRLDLYQKTWNLLN